MVESVCVVGQLNGADGYSTVLCWWTIEGGTIGILWSCTTSLCYIEVC